MNRIRIGNRRIGDGCPCYIIAEAGSNHNGSLAMAKRLVDAASRAGADAVKFQFFRADLLYVQGAGRAGYLESDEGIYETIKRAEIPYSWLGKLSAHAKMRGIGFMASAFDECGANAVDRHVRCHKIASYESGHLPLIREVARLGKPVVISTGASTLAEVRQAVAAFRSTGNRKLALMQCTAKYPAQPGSLNLKAIPALKKAFGVPVGFSDHSLDPVVAPVAAVALGANILEKHFTMSRSLPGPDHRFALEPSELARMVSAVRAAELMMGNGRKEVHPAERELMFFARRAVQATRDIAKGEVFSDANVAVLRPGNARRGLEPKFIGKVLGKKARRSIRRDEGIRKGDF